MNINTTWQIELCDRMTELPIKGARVGYVKGHDGPYNYKDVAEELIKDDWPEEIARIEWEEPIPRHVRIWGSCVDEHGETLPYIVWVEEV